MEYHLHAEGIGELICRQQVPPGAPSFAVGDRVGWRLDAQTAHCLDDSGGA